ncbi:MAG: hypothetical protein RL757_1607 [Bacteroidota bacterium]
MLKKFGFLAVALFIGAVACNRSASSAAKHEASEEAAYAKFKANANSDGKHFGESFDAKNMVAYDAVFPKLKALDGKEKVENVIVTGTVGAVCKAKGCWMTIQSQAGAPDIFVKFKDYGFFMPKDIIGKKVAMNGYAFKEVTDVATLRHFAEDEGKSKEDIAKITQPKEEYKFLASGVVILD